jgi:plastocyanin
MLIRMLALTGFAPLILLAACGGDDNATTTFKATPTVAPVGTSPVSGLDLTITAADFSLSPATITASAGQVINITFKNTGAAEHNFTVSTKDVTDAVAGDAKTGTFTASATTMEFHCKYHPTQMKGIITITGSAGSNGLGATSPPSKPHRLGLSGLGY